MLSNEQRTGHAKHSLWNDRSGSGSHHAMDIKEVMAWNLPRKPHDQHMTQERRVSGFIDQRALRLGRRWHRTRYPP